MRRVRKWDRWLRWLRSVFMSSPVFQRVRMWGPWSSASRGPREEQRLGCVLWMEEEKRHGKLMKHIWNFQAQQGRAIPRLCVTRVTHFFSMPTRPHVRHKRSVKILSLIKELCFTCLAHLQCHCLHKTSLPALWMVPKVRRITGLWCRKSSLEGNPSRWPGESSISTSSRLRWLRRCIVWLVWHLGDSFAKLAGLLD